MAKIKEKTIRRWTATGDDTMILAASNIVLNRNKYIEPSVALAKEADQNDLSNLGDPIIWIRWYNGKPYFLSSDGYLFYKSSGSYYEDTEMSSHAASVGMGEFDGNLYVTTGGNLHKYDGSSWTLNWATNLPSSTADGIPMQEFLDAQYIGCGRYLVKNDGTSTSTVLTLPSGYTIKFLEKTGAYLIIGADASSETRVFWWDGTSTQYNYQVKIGSGFIAATSDGQTVYAMTADGRIFAFGGEGAYKELYRPPGFPYKLANWSSVIDGMKARDGKLYINLKCPDYRYDLSYEDGIWAFDLRTGDFYKFASHTMGTDIDNNGIGYVQEVGALYLSGSNFLNGYTMATLEEDTSYYTIEQINPIGAPSFPSYFIVTWQGMENNRNKEFIKLKIDIESDGAAYLTVAGIDAETFLTDRTSLHRSGSWQGTNNTFTFSPPTSQGHLVKVSSGYNAGEMRFVDSWDDATDLLTVDRAFSKTPTSGKGSFFRVFPTTKIYEEQLPSSETRQVIEIPLSMVNKTKALALLIAISDSSKWKRIRDITVSWKEADRE